MAPTGALRFRQEVPDVPALRKPEEAVMDIVDDLRVHLDYLSRTVLLQVREKYVRQDDDGNRAQTDNQARETDASAGSLRRIRFVRW